MERPQCPQDGPSGADLPSGSGRLGPLCKPPSDPSLPRGPLPVRGPCSEPPPPPMAACAHHCPQDSFPRCQSRRTPPCPASWVLQGPESVGSRFRSQGRAHLPPAGTPHPPPAGPRAVCFLVSCASAITAQSPACGGGDAPQEPAEEEDDGVCSRVTRAGKMWRGEARRGMSWREMRPRVSEGPRRSGHQQSPRGKLGEAEPCRCRTQGPQPHSQAHGHPAGGPHLTR